MSITVTGPPWPSTQTLRAALASAPEIGTIAWGRSTCNKLEALTRLRAAGLYTPIYTTSLDEARQWRSWGLLVWGRMTRHSKGRDIATVRGHRWDTRDFWVQRITDVTHEFRAHAWGGRGFRLGVKRHNGATHVPGTRYASSIHADRKGWELCYSQETLNGVASEEVRRSLRQTAVEACAALSVPGGAVDLLLTRRGEIFVLEVNTAPALGEMTLGAYVEAIRRAFAPPVEPRPRRVRTTSSQ